LTASTNINLKKLLIIILLAGFVAKIAIGFHLKDSFLNRGNSKTNLNALACNLYVNGEYSLVQGIPSVDYEPLYPALMSISYAITGYNWLGLTILQAVLHLITSLLLFKIGTRLFHPIAGFFAACYHAFYPYLFTYSFSIYDTTLFVFLLVLTIELLLTEKLSSKRLVLAGIIIGLAFLTRATIITFLPGLFLYVFYRYFKSQNVTAAFISCSLIVAGCLLAMAPWLVRNYSLTGKLLISTHGSFGMWQGNNPLSFEYLKANKSLDEIYRLNPPLPIYAQYPLAARTPDEDVKVSAAYQQEAVNWIKNNFPEFVSMGWLKAEKLWSWNRNPDSKSVKFGSNEGRKSVYLISYLPILLLFPFGLILLFKKHPVEAFTLLLILLAFTGAHSIAIGFTRARIPIDFFLMLCSGITITWLLQRFFPSLYLKFKSS